MNLDQKIQKFKELLPVYKTYFTWSNVKEIKMPNDGLYLFVCKTYSGKSKRDSI